MPDPNPHFRLKRVYLPTDAEDGTRVLVDRLWPRGLQKAEAHIDHWLKELAPSAELRKWFAHDPARWSEFRTRYRAELRANDPAVTQLRNLAAAGSITLLYAAHDEAHNNARVLLDYLETAPPTPDAHHAHAPS
jgi:uncharacterized protein YeaO (DUF488 family)